MSLLSGRVGTATVTLSLIGLTFVLIGLSSQFWVADSILTELPTITSQVAAFLLLSFGGVIAVRNAIRTHYRVLWVLGVVLMQAAYVLLGLLLIGLTDPADPVYTVSVVGGAVVAIFALLLFYGFWSSRSFHLWEVYAVLLGLSAAVLTVAATRVRAVIFVAGAILVISLMMYVIHVIARFKRSVPKPLRNGARLYVAITGLPIELALYLPSALIRRVF